MSWFLYNDFVCINKAVYISGFTVFCKIKLWGTKTMVNTCKERSLSYVFIAGQAKTCRTFLFGLSMYDYYLDSILMLSKFYMSKTILDSSKTFWIRPKMTFHNLCLPFEPCQKSWSSPQEKHAELSYWGSTFLINQIPSSFYTNFTQILSWWN